MAKRNSPFRREAARVYFRARVTLVFAKLKDDADKDEINFLEILVNQLKRDWERTK